MTAGFIFDYLLLLHIIDFSCGLDRHLLGTPEYSATLRLAFKETHVFKFADKPMLQFQCQISVCIKYDDGCKEITVQLNCF